MSLPFEYDRVAVGEFLGTTPTTTNFEHARVAILPVPLDRTTSPREVPRWDSLQHIALVSAIERAFGIALSMDEMMEMRSLGDIEAVLRRHGAR